MPDMIETLSRSLRVRDDGTGKSRDMDGTLAEFEAEDAVILLGDPGMGKTTLFTEAAKTNYTTVRNFLINPRAVTGTVLFLDALDEYRNLVSGHDASAEVAKELCVLKKPKFRLSCRAADWFGATDQEVFRAASASGRVVVLELRPFSHDEILNAVQGIVPDPIKFMEETESAGLAKLLGNPQTLELLALAWMVDKKPQNKFEAYEVGVTELLKETNDNHIRRGVDSPDLGELRKAAGAVASILLLSNSVGISRSETADGPGFVSLSVVPYANRNDVDAVLKRRLFVSMEVDRFEPIHRTIVEFLAAEDLSQRIASGLSIDRVMALLCGVDGNPVSSLRGLFAWLMCRLGLRAEDYVERDPYGVATYGDASVLPPSAQNAIWTGLRRLRDPWFLVAEDDCGSFRDLVNPSTAKITLEFLQDPTIGIHLRIAVLEAIANSTKSIGMDAILRNMVLAKHDNTWLRTTAVRAFVQSVKNDWGKLETLDCELAQASDDLIASEVRVELLLLTRSYGSLPLRMLSIMEQAAKVKKESHTFGHFYPLQSLPSDADLDVILDNAAGVLISENDACYELRSLFERWLRRRLKLFTPITPTQIISWLRNLRGGRWHNPEDILASLKTRFVEEPLFFREVFALIGNSAPKNGQSGNFFIPDDLWQLLPEAVWPTTPCELFLEYAEKDVDPDRAAAFFRMYLIWFPLEGASVSFAEAGFDLLDRRRDVAKALGDWRSCKIEGWRAKRLHGYEEDESLKRAENQAHNITSLTPHLTTIRAGGDEHVLGWAANIYLGFQYSLKDIPEARERLACATNDEISNALIEGIIRYVETAGIPKKKELTESWLANKFVRSHNLLGLSVFLRHNAGMTVPEPALPHCIAAVATACNGIGVDPDYGATLSAWLLHEVRHHPDVVKSVLLDLWIAGMSKNNDSLPRFYELSHAPDSQQFLASLSADVLKAKINDNHESVGKLVSILLCYDQRTVLEIGKTELARTELPAEVRVIWGTALFVIDPSNYSGPWKAMMAEPNAALWEAIEVLNGNRYTNHGSVNLSSAQREDVITALGLRFANVGHPSSGWSGSQDPWDASEFVVNQIKLLAADSSAEVGAQLERLEHKDGLVSYRDVIRHHRAQHEKQQRESSFTFASAEAVAQAIMNHAPATPTDLLAFIVDHLGVLSHELARTQRERYRAYWNEEGRNLIAPKREEVCSGLLAEDLQNRVRVQDLIVTVEHHMIEDKECDLVVSQGTDRLLPIEVKHHYNPGLWTAWHTQLDRLYSRDAMAGGLGIYLVLWSGEAKGRRMPKLPDGLKRPVSASELKLALELLVPEGDRQRLKIVVVDISGP